MRLLCQLCLLGAFVGLGYAGFACLVGWRMEQRFLRRTGLMSGVCGFGSLTAAMVILSVALVTNDFRFAYVAHYTSPSLPWYYSLSALWVGQAGSLLLWTWLTALLALIYHGGARRTSSSLQEPTFGLLMLLSWFLVASTVFAVDPAAASLVTPRDGAGLSPLLQHPAMLVHPPVIFLAYAAWSIPLALSIAALWTGQLGNGWTRETRRWALFAWAVLGSGILLGAAWAYEELGWGGYWGWDPVENGSLLPWLTGTALIHALMVWQHAGTLKKTAVILAVATFAMCSFATFLTRSGIFSSVHAFSQSAIGWLFLVLMVVLTVGAGALLVMRRAALRPDKPMAYLLCRETMVAASMLALVLLAIVVCGGTVSSALSAAVVGRTIMVGAPFYNNVLIPTGILLLATTSTAPLLRWGAPPTSSQQAMLWLSTILSLISVAFIRCCGVGEPLGLVVVALAVFAMAALMTSLWLEATRRETVHPWAGLFRALRTGRRTYAGFLAHLGFFCLAIGVTFSARGAQQHDVSLKVGESVDWLGYRVRLIKLQERQDPDKLVAQALLEVTPADATPFTLQPSQHFHLPQREWTSEVAIQSTWTKDFYTILHGGDGSTTVHLTLRQIPMMRWLWGGGFVMVAAALVALVPAGRMRPVRPACSQTAGTPRSRPPQQRPQPVTVT